MRTGQNEPAKQMLERAVMTARSLDSAVVLLRPASFIAVLLETGDELIQYWRPCPGSPYVPTFQSEDGSTWPIEVSERLYSHNQQKTLGAITRGLRHAPARG